MADADAAPPTPPPEVVAPEEHPAAADSAVAALQEEAATAEVDKKRKLEEEGFQRSPYYTIRETVANLRGRFLQVPAENPNILEFHSAIAAAVASSR